MPPATPLIQQEQNVAETAFSGSNRTRLLVLLIVWAISIGYMSTHLKRNWVAHDEGTLGQSAERALHGQLPHRDFEDYTGGVTFMNALAFREFGISSASMRWVLFIFFVPWVPAIFYVASRFGSAYSAGAVTLLAVAWSVPNNAAPMPSWYNLFFAVFGVAALLRHLEAGRRRWLFIAGLCGGLSFLAKITAAFFVAGVLLWFIFREQSDSEEQNGKSPAPAALYKVFVTLGLAIFLAVLFTMVLKVPGIGGPFYFALPAFAVVVLLMAREFSGIAGGNEERFRALAAMCLPFAGGLAIPVLVFLVPYARAGALQDLGHGLFLVSARAVQSVTFAPESPMAIAAMAPFVAPIIIAQDSGNLGKAISGAILALLCCLVLIYSATVTMVYQIGWYSLKSAIPVLVVSGAVILWVAGRQRKLSPSRQQQIMLVLCIAALCSVIQFPFSAPVYFFYVAPLAILLAMALFAYVPRPPRLALSMLIAFYILFAVVRITPSGSANAGFGYAADLQTKRLTFPRAGGLRVGADDARMYNQLIPLVQSHAAGKFIYATPNSPEVYFFSGLQSPTRYYYEFFQDPIAYSERILHMVETLDVNVVVIKNAPKFLYLLPPELRGELERRYPHSAEAGFFEVRWKE